MAKKNYGYYWGTWDPKSSMRLQTGQQSINIKHTKPNIKSFSWDYNKIFIKDETEV